VSDNRAIVYVEDAVLPVYRASSIGLPLRCLTAARAGNTPLEPPEYLTRAADAGTAIESVVKARLTEQGYTINDEQDTVEVSVFDDGEEIAVIRGHLDASSIASPHDDIERMLEVKSMSTNVFDKWIRHRFDGFPTYAAQLSVYMHATGLPALYAVICRDTDEMELIEYDTPPIAWDVLAQKVRAVEAFNALGIMPPCTGATYPCSYNYLCDRSELSVDDLAKSVDSDTAMADAIAEYNRARDMEAQVAQIKATARDDLIAAMAGRSKVDVGLTRVQFITSKKKTLNVRALRGRLGHELDAFYDEKEYTQLRVSEKKEKDDA
jgi:hypothetical protein